MRLLRNDLGPTWLNKLANCLTPRRIRAQAIILMVCLWSGAIVDFSTSGTLDRVGNIKFQDFLVFYTSGKLVRQHRSNELFNQRTEAQETQALLERPAQIQLPTVYGPQVGFFFSPFSRMSFFTAASFWVAISILTYLLCCYWIWHACPSLYSARDLIISLVLAFPPFSHFVVRGQLSSVVLLCFVAAYYAFRSRHDWLAGLALGALIFKPQFLIGIVVILLWTRAWKNVTGLFIGCLAQLGLTWAYFGTEVMRTYASTLWHLPQMTTNLEPGVAHTQMHSLRSFWVLLFPWREVSATLYAISAIAVLYIAAKAWRSSGPLALRFSALVLATVLVNPHLFVYDLLVLAPVFFLVTDWMIQHLEHPWSPGVRALLYLSFLLPLFGPMAIWTHIQLSVIVFVGLLIVLTYILNQQTEYINWSN